MLRSRRSERVSAHLDPEDLESILAAFHDRCTDVVERLGGLVVPFSGEGILAYFGVPLAGEDDAERAVRAGLGIVYATAAIDAGPRRTFGSGSPLELGSCASVATAGTLATLWSAKHPILRAGFGISPTQARY